MNDVPTHNQRQLMQLMEGRGWVKAFQLPDARQTIKGLLDRGWIESRAAGRELSYKITAEGVAAKRKMIPGRPINSNAHQHS